MGMNEDDRIRSKNKKHQDAYELYEGLVAAGYDSTYIRRHIEFAKAATQDSFRNEVLNTVLNIVRSVDRAKDTNN